MTVLKQLKLRGAAWLVSSAGTASGFHVTLGSSNGTLGYPFQIIVSLPPGQVWPAQTLSALVSGLAGNLVMAQPVAGSAGSVVLSFTPTSGTSGTVTVFGSTMQNLDPHPTYAIVSPVASGFSSTPSSTSGIIGQQFQIILAPLPSGSVWPSGGILLSVQESGASMTFSPGSTIAPTAGSSSALVVNVTSTSVGVGNFTFTNNTNLVNPVGFNYTASVAPPAPPAGVANRFDVIPSASFVAVGTPVTLTIYPNGKAPSGTVTLASVKGTFSPSASATMVIDSTSTMSISYTPTVEGEHNISATNNAGMFNPYIAPLNVGAAASGTARTISASVVRWDNGIFQRDTFAGSPNGFSLSWARGWGEVWITISAISGATAGLWIKFFDADSTGATSVAGTGTALHTTPVQVYGALSATGQIRLLLPAGPYYYKADIATDASFTNPIRLDKTFRVGDVIGMDTRSFECGLGRGYAESSPSPVVGYTKTTTWVGFDRRYGNDNSGWYRHDPAVTDPYPYHYSDPASAATQEIGRLWESQRGVALAITGMAVAGGGLNSMFGSDGTGGRAMQDTVAASVWSKFRYYWAATSGMDNGVTETQSLDRSTWNGAVLWIARTYPACAIIGWVAGASGWFGTNGSSPLGYARNQSYFLNTIEPGNSMVVSKDNPCWNEYVAGHASQAARIHFARTGFRQLMALEQTAFNGFGTTNRGPTLSSTGTISGRIISIPYTLHGGTALTAVGISFSDPNYTVGAATAAEIASVFSVYVAGGYSGSGLAIKINSAAINSVAGTIDLVLTGSSGVTYTDGSTAALPSGFSVHYAADFGVSNATLLPHWMGGSPRAAFLADNRSDNGITYGWPMRIAIDISIA